jgi:DEAD/DEAH box helicase domain-containing protein
MLPTFRDQDRQGAWKLDSTTVPFAFEYLRRASFREMNFGEHSDDAAKFSIAGQLAARQGFVICKRCGKVQQGRKRQQTLATDVRGDHTIWCLARQRGEKESDFEAAVYLYREFSSEAVRLLLPLADLGSERRLASFVAAFQLGLKDRYGGRVDHLQTLVYSEPERGSLLRRQYLVLYDAVPGGHRIPEGSGAGARGRCRARTRRHSSDARATASGHASASGTLRAMAAIGACSHIATAAT